MPVALAVARVSKFFAQKIRVWAPETLISYLNGFLNQCHPCTPPSLTRHSCTPSLPSCICSSVHAGCLNGHNLCPRRILQTTCNNHKSEDIDKLKVSIDEIKMQLLELKATITSSPTEQPSNDVVPTPQLVSPLEALPPDPEPPSLSDSIASYFR